MYVYVIYQFISAICTCRNPGLRVTPCAKLHFSTHLRTFHNCVERNWGHLHKKRKGKKQCMIALHWHINLHQYYVGGHQIIDHAER